MNKDDLNKTISERLLLDLQAAKDGGLPLNFEDVLSGLERAKMPFTAGIRVENIADCIIDACRRRLSAPVTARMVALQAVTNPSEGKTVGDVAIRSSTTLVRHGLERHR